MNGGQGGAARPGFEPTSRATPASELIDRLRRVLRPEDLDCACRERLDGALERGGLGRSLRSRSPLAVAARRVLTVLGRQPGEAA